MKLIAHTENEINWLRLSPFILLHLFCFNVIWVGCSNIALWFCFFSYFFRMFFITGFYHRYFSHKTFKTNRFFQFLFGFLGATAGQRGPLWWASHHRQHHRHTDTEQDPHSPLHQGFLWSHIQWFLTQKNFHTDYNNIPDLEKFTELKWLDKFEDLAPILLGVSCYCIGSFLGSYKPDLQTNGLQLLTWGFIVPTVLVMHVTFCINSIAHSFGKKRYKTKDESRNNFILAILTLGEGWHNNHHHFPGSVRQGFYWWEIDITYYLLKVLNFLGIIRDLKMVPIEFREGGKYLT
jgi:stearoyl-CoA desaturase (delta-9 desaturase)